MVYLLMFVFAFLPEQLSYVQKTLENKNISSVCLFGAFNFESIGNDKNTGKYTKKIMFSECFNTKPCSRVSIVLKRLMKLNIVFEEKWNKIL